MLDFDSTARLFGDRVDLLHTTSTIPYPVFKGGKNYCGYSPRMTRHPLVRRFIDECLRPEVAQFANALFVPNGPAVAEALLAAGVGERGCSSDSRTPRTGPGAKNRAETFDRERDQMARKVSAWASTHLAQ